MSRQPLDATCAAHIGLELQANHGPFIYCHQPPGHAGQHESWGSGLIGTRGQHIDYAITWARTLSKDD